MVNGIGAKFLAAQLPCIWRVGSWRGRRATNLPGGAILWCMVRVSRSLARQPWARRAIGLFTGEGLPERDWKARGGNISLLRTLTCPGPRAADALIDRRAREGKTRESVGQISDEMNGPPLGFLRRPIGGPHPYLLLETMVAPVRSDGRLRPMTVVMAIGVRSSGHREVLGADVAEELSVTFWINFLKSLRRRGLEGIRLVTADDHDGLQLALRTVLPAAAWQRCLTHFVSQAVDAVPPSARPFVAAMFRGVFAQKHREAARRAIDRISRRLARRNPWLAELLRQADPAGLTYYGFPVEHRRQIWSTNAERLLGELAQRCDLVGTFPGRRALLRVVAGVLEQQDAGWRAAGPYCKPPAQAGPGTPDPFRQISLDSSRRALVGAAS